LSEEQALKIFVQINQGLSFLHQNNIVHRDLKPQNIIVFENGMFKIADIMGVSRQIEHSKVFLTKSLGTTAYNAPEAELDSANFTSDIFALGLILFFMLQKQGLYFD